MFEKMNNNVKPDNMKVFHDVEDSDKPDKLEKDMKVFHDVEDSDKPDKLEEDMKVFFMIVIAFCLSLWIRPI